jgi:hypothetical protein
MYAEHVLNTPQLKQCKSAFVQTAGALRLSLVFLQRSVFDRRRDPGRGNLINTLKVGSHAPLAYVMHQLNR